MIRCKPLLGTYVEVFADLDIAIDQAFLAVQLVNDLMSFHNPDSELSQVNARAHIKPIRVHEWTFQVLSAAKELYENTEGMFDCAVGKKLVESGLLPQHPDLLSSSSNHTLDLMLSEPNTVFTNTQLTLDLGGIAKGFAVDRAVEALQQYGAKSGYVNAGGDLRVFGNAAYDIQIRNPHHPSELITLGTLENGAIASSGLYYCDRLKTNQGHIVNPKTMQQILFTESYSVIAPECMHADALTKVLAISRNSMHPCFHQYSAQAIGVTG